MIAIDRQRLTLTALVEFLLACFLLLIALELTGCAGRFDEARGSVEVSGLERADSVCDSWRARGRWANAAEVTLMAAEAVPAAALIYTRSPTRLAIIGGSTAALGALALGAKVLSEGYASDIANFCTP
jgi:hypothetical protein